MTDAAASANNRWLYRTSTNHDDVEDFINEHGPTPDSIQAGVSGPNLHVWIRDEHSSYHYELKVDRWRGPDRTGAEIQRRLSTGEIVFLGFEHNTYYYLEVLR